MKGNTQEDVKSSVRYKVICVVNRELYPAPPELFATPQGAFEAMLEEMQHALTNAGELSKETWDALIPDVKRAIKDAGDYEQEDMGIRTNSAWFNGHYNWDWFALEIPYFD